MVGLSEKAKGKQRALGPQDVPESSSSSSPQDRALTVRFTDGSPDVSVSLSPKDTVRQVKQKIRILRPPLVKRRLRLICSGRMLSDDIILPEWLAILENRQRKVSEKLPGDDAETSSSNESSVSWLHCSIGAELADGEEEDSGIQKTQIKPLRGFDRLAAAGFTEEDIAIFRRTFHSQSTGDYLDSAILGEDDDYDEHARALEEQWIETLDDPGATAVNQSSTSETILQGLIVGFFFPLLPFFFLREGRQPVFWENGTSQERQNSVVFTKRMQMALVLGFMVNITFGLWRYLLGG